jgi:hypothetical protein
MIRRNKADAYLPGMLYRDAGGYPTPYREEHRLQVDRFILRKNSENPTKSAIVAGPSFHYPG